MLRAMRRFGMFPGKDSRATFEALIGHPLAELPRFRGGGSRELVSGTARFIRICWRGASWIACLHDRAAKICIGWKIGIGGHLAVPPLPHHRAYGSRTAAVRPG